jgi:hypothetical protein
MDKGSFAAFVNGGTSFLTNEPPNHSMVANVDKLVHCCQSTNHSNLPTVTCPAKATPFTQ